MFCNPDFSSFPRVTAAALRGNGDFMKKFLFPLLMFLALGALALRADDKTPADDTKAADEVAVIKTTDGDMVIGFWPDVAPNTVANFIKLAKAGFYDGTLFHRIIKGFMIQGGDPNTKKPEGTDNVWGTGGPGYTIKDEFSKKHHGRGVISMAHTGAPDSAGSQFFICLADADSLDGQYAAFGKLIKGDDVLTKLGDTPVESNGREASKPVDPPKIISIKIVPADSVK